eukprot:gene27306-32982_t
MSSFTKEMIFSVPSSLAESQAAEMRLQPTTGTAAYTTPGSLIQFEQQIQPATFADFPNTLVLTGRVTFAGLSNAARCQMMGTFMSLFSTIRIRIGGVLVDEIVNPSQLMMKIFDLTLTQSDRRMLSGMMGFDPLNPGGQGLLLGCNNDANGTTANSVHNWAPSSTVFSFALPIPCSLTNASTLFPLFAAQVQWEFVVANPADYLIFNAGTTLPTISIDRLELCFNTLRLADAPFRALMAMQPMTPDGELVIKTDSWTYTSGQLAGQQAPGRVDVSYTPQYKSISKLLITSSPANAAEKSFAGVNPNLAAGQLIVGNRQFPQLPCRLDHPAEVLYQSYKGLGSLYSSSHIGSMDPYSFAKSSTAGFGGGLHVAYNSTANMVTAPVLMAGAGDLFTTANSRNAMLSQNKWLWMLDTESLVNDKQNVFSGMSTRGSGSSVLRLTIGEQLANTIHTLHIWSNIQMLLKLNVVTFQCTVDY